MKTKEEIDKLVEKNQGLVVHVIQKYFHVTVRMYEFQREDMIQEGMIGLFKAAQSYDESKGIAFSTFACKCIYYAIRRYSQRYLEKHYDYSKVVYAEDENEDGLKLINSLYIEEDFGIVEVEELLYKLQPHLSENEKIILKMRMEGYYQKDIGKKVNQSQVNISRVLKCISIMINQIKNDEDIVRVKGRPVKVKNTEIYKKVA